ncbi:hypothetical protein [uncultured Ruminococcus sp.]|uniref:hypothetical protein n=1 Tax=Eubacterium sp. TaxID=142586 RepID=UPI00266CC26C|nr:hypothetical protein [uncultured Ruminococcus sp.]
MFSLTKSKKEDSSSCATTESQKGERNKKKEEESNSLKAAILELIFAITIVCFVQIGTTTKNEKLEILMMILSTIVFLITVIFEILLSLYNKKQKKTKK